MAGVASYTREIFLTGTSRITAQFPVGIMVSNLKFETESIARHCVPARNFVFLTSMGRPPFIPTTGSGGVNM